MAVVGRWVRAYQRGWRVSEQTGEYEQVAHPEHYGGQNDPYEAIKVIEAWWLGFCLGNAVKYIARAGRKPGVDAQTDLRKAAWYVARELERIGAGEGDG